MYSSGGALFPPFGFWIFVPPDKNTTWQKSAAIKSIANCTSCLLFFVYYVMLKIFVHLYLRKGTYKMTASNRNVQCQSDLWKWILVHVLSNKTIYRFCYNVHISVDKIKLANGYDFMVYQVDRTKLIFKAFCVYFKVILPGQLVKPKRRLADVQVCP